MLTIKVKYESTIREVRVKNENIPFKELLGVIERHFEGTFCRINELSYLDENGSTNTIFTDSDLNLALKTLGKSGKLIILVDGEPMFSFF